jgi:cysteinyl-tRNA synthetase
VTLRLFDSATRSVGDFSPIEPRKVGIYLCGATVQSAPHIGHMRAAVAFDVLRRWLERGGVKVTMIRNVTDVGDTIFAKAEAAGVPWWEWALQNERLFTAGYDALGNLPPAYEPRATGHIPEMLVLIAQLIDSGHAYEKDGSVYFDVRSFPAYGSLTNQAIEDLAPEEDSPEAAKRDARDFALWKAAKADDPAGATWGSPWGPGRPGWHIECSAMARRFLGESFDIHGGGLDLRFPHHENEQAQSRAAGDGFARLWMHSAWVTQGGAKMSKSLGNTLLVDAVLAEHSAAALRLALVGVHYRSMLEYGDATMDDAEATWARLAGFVARAGERVGQSAAASLAEVELPTDFVEAMDDDLAVPRAMAVVFKYVSAGNKLLEFAESAVASGELDLVLGRVRAMLDVLGLDPEAAPWAGQSGGAPLEALDALVRAEIDARAAAREAKDWATADAIRDRLAAAGIALEDGQEGVRWTFAGER